MIVDIVQTAVMRSGAVTQVVAGGGGGKLYIFTEEIEGLWVVKAPSKDRAEDAMLNELMERYGAEEGQDRLIDGEWQEVIFDSQGIYRLT